MHIIIYYALLHYANCNTCAFMGHIYIKKPFENSHRINYISFTGTLNNITSDIQCNSNYYEIYNRVLSTFTVQKCNICATMSNTFTWKSYFVYYYWNESFSSLQSISCKFKNIKKYFMYDQIFFVNEISFKTKTMA